MKVFVSWSGERSQWFAAALKEWLEQCIQSVEVFFSPDDIEKGENWQRKLDCELREAHYGIVCLTPENVDSPWIHFEAGALSKMLDSRVMVLAIQVSFADIKGPLKSFQATKPESGDLYKLLRAVNGLQERPLSEEKLRNSFEAFWPAFSQHIEEIRSASFGDDVRGAPKVNVGETVDEILRLVRMQNATLQCPEKLLPGDYLAVAMAKHATHGVEERVWEELYAFTKYVLEEYGRMPQENGVLGESYLMMIKRISADCPLWHQKFSPLFRRHRSRLRPDGTVTASVAP